MKSLTRRAFGKTILAAGTAPFMGAVVLPMQSEQPQRVIALPERVAGYLMTEDERQLALKFLAHHEKNIQPLRERDLPNGLVPHFIFASPVMKGENGKAVR